MTEEELMSKMDELGLLMHDWEIAQEGLEASHYKMLKRIGDLKDELKDYFLKEKKSMTGETLVVTYRKGAVKWDTKCLDGYSLEHPEITKFRKEGTPTIAFKVREEHDDDGR